MGRRPRGRPADRADGGREGRRLAPAHGPWHAGPRLHALPAPTTHSSRRRPSSTASPPTARPRRSTTSSAPTSTRSISTPELRAQLADPATVDEALAAIPDVRVAKFAHACTHMTISPNIVHGGVKTNVIPDEVVLEVDIRTLPGQTGEDVDAVLADALGPLADRVTVETLHERPSTQSPRPHRLPTPSQRARSPRCTRRRRCCRASPSGGTDATFFRDKGSIAYGFGLFSRDVTYQDFASPLPRPRRAHRRGVAPPRPRPAGSTSVVTCLG